MARGSALSRTVEYFKEGNIEEVQYVLARAGAIVAERTGGKSKATITSARKQKRKKQPIHVTSGNMNLAVAEQEAES